MPGHLLLRLCLRLQPPPPPPPLPLLPPPRGIVANPPSFPPPSARGRLGNPQPSPGASASGVAGAPARGVECAPCPGRRARGAEVPAAAQSRGARHGGVLLEAPTAGWAGLELFPTRPLPGLCWAPRGRGHTQSLRAFAESQLSQWKGPTNPDVQASHFTVGATEVQRKGGPPPKSVT